MTITRVGTNDKYASGWDSIFGGKKKAKPATAKASESKPVAAKKAVKKAKTVTAKPTTKKAAKKATKKAAKKK